MPAGPERIVCPSCKSNNMPGQTKCWKCGVPLQQPSLPRQASPPPPRAHPTSAVAPMRQLQRGSFQSDPFVQHLRAMRTPFQSEWSIAIEFRVSSSSMFDEILARARRYPSFQEMRTETGKSLYSVSFGVSQVEEFERLYSLVKSWKGIELKVCGQAVSTEDVNKWLRCFRDKVKCLRSNPLFCWGASSMTFNVFGCHRTMIRDAHPEWTDNWYEFASMRTDGVCLIDKATIAARISENLKPYRFCPALSMDFTALGFSIIPDQVDPRVDRDWDYVYLQGGRVPMGVRPKLTELVLDTTTQSVSTLTGKLDISMSTCMTVDVTPQFADLYLKLQSLFGMKKQSIRPSTQRTSDSHTSSLPSDVPSPVSQPRIQRGGQPQKASGSGCGVVALAIALLAVLVFALR